MALGNQNDLYTIVRNISGGSLFIATSQRSGSSRRKKRFFYDFCFWFYRLSGVQQFVYNTSPSSLTPTQEATFNVVPLSQMLAGNSSNQYKTGTIAVSSTNTTITGTSSAFTSEYTVGDYLYVSGVTKRITSISSATSMTVDSVYGSTTSGLNHQKIYHLGLIPLFYHL